MENMRFGGCAPIQEYAFNEREKLRELKEKKGRAVTGLSVFFEMCFLLCFAAAWPANIVKSWRSRTARGKSLVFPLIVEAGYIFGIISKFTADSLTYALFFYFLNFTMVAIDLVLTLRNRRLDAKRDLELAKRGIVA